MGKGAHNPLHVSEACSLLLFSYAKSTGYARAFCLSFAHESGKIGTYAEKELVQNYFDESGLVRDSHVLCTYWGGMLEEGADTFWELHNPENPNESPYGGTIVNSYCHAWSCAPAYFLRKFQ